MVSYSSQGVRNIQLLHRDIRTALRMIHLHRNYPTHILPRHRTRLKDGPPHPRHILPTRTGQIVRTDQITVVTI